MRRFSLYLYMSILLFYTLLMLCNPQVAYQSAGNALTLFVYVVFPSLFPFMVLMDLLLKTKFLKIISILFEPLMKPIFNLPGVASLPLLSGLFSGYPGGAIVTAGLRENHLLTKQEAEHLMTFCNNASPVFITGAVGTGLLQSPELGWMLFKNHMLAGLTVGILFRFLIKKEKTSHVSAFSSEHLQENKGEFDLAILTAAIFKSVKNLIIIGAFIILFGVLIGILHNFSFVHWIGSQLDDLLFKLFGIQDAYDSYSTFIFYGLIELSNGIKLIANAKMPLWISLTSISLILGWGSLSVHFQAFGILRKTDIKGRIYIWGKLCHGILAAIYTALYFL